MNERPSLAEALAKFFLARPGVWTDGKQVASVAGWSGWRARLSDVRRPPYNLDVRNRRRSVRVGDHTVRLTEYCFTPAVEAQQESVDRGQHGPAPHQPGLWS